MFLVNEHLIWLDDNYLLSAALDVHNFIVDMFLQHLLD